MIDKDLRANILRVKPRFGPPLHLNDVTINFEYMNVCIAELQIKLLSGHPPLTYFANHLVYEIERTCESKDRYMLFGAFNKALLYPAKQGDIYDSMPELDMEEDIKNR